MTKKVDFIIAGSAKSGTTAMTLMLDQHPDICTSEIKETNYFIQGFEPTQHLNCLNGKSVLLNQEKSDIIDSADKYSALFKDAHGKKMLGEASPWYLLNSNVPLRLRNYNSNIKVIIMLRKPTNVAFSNFLHQIRDNAESVSVDDMDAFFDESRYESTELHPFCNHLALPKYSKHLPAYLKEIPKENLYIMVYEEFLIDKKGHFNNLLSFLGLRQDVDINLERAVNVSGLPKSKKIHSVIQGSMGLKKMLRLIMQKKARKKLRSYIEMLNTGAKPSLPLDAKTQLDAFYKAEVHYVEEVLGRKISVWH